MTGIACVAALLAASGSLRAQITNSIPRYEWRAEHDPNGTGKFYFGSTSTLFPA